MRFINLRTKKFSGQFGDRLRSSSQTGIEEASQTLSNQNYPSNHAATSACYHAKTAFPIPAIAQPGRWKPTVLSTSKTILIVFKHAPSNEANTRPLVSVAPWSENSDSTEPCSVVSKTITAVSIRRLFAKRANSSIADQLVCAKFSIDSTAKALCYKVSRKFWIRRIVSSRPRISMDSKSGGETFWPVRATRSGPKANLGLMPRSSTKRARNTD